MRVCAKNMKLPAITLFLILQSLITSETTVSSHEISSKHIAMIAKHYKNLVKRDLELRSGFVSQSKETNLSEGQSNNISKIITITSTTTTIKPQMTSFKGNTSDKNFNEMVIAIEVCLTISLCLAILTVYIQCKSKCETNIENNGRTGLRLNSLNDFNDIISVNTEPTNRGEFN
ncbi:uncharacterized protein LOC128961340 isoform X2 [Oppia nitens]|uniref:uncharacterized protein LOC128961340 isoform X2 n=1 Tax=Oppia nitens TaxID=1686743 RepID=UPI0023DB59EA|nr:uncharacterized protein LOC128961340 isoform X2 [Oppia nitens]